MSTCPGCGTVVDCAVAAGRNERCWCMDLPPLPSPASTAAATSPVAEIPSSATCWCPACLLSERERRLAGEDTSPSLAAQG